MRRENHEIKKNMANLLEKYHNDKVYRQEIERVKSNIYKIRN